MYSKVRTVKYLSLDFWISCVCGCASQVCGSGPEKREAGPTWTLLWEHAVLQRHCWIHHHLGSQRTHWGTKRWDTCAYQQAFLIFSKVCVCMCVCKMSLNRSVSERQPMTTFIFMCVRTGGRPAQWPLHYVWRHHCHSRCLQGGSTVKNHTFRYISGTGSGSCSLLSPPIPVLWRQALSTERVLSAGGDHWRRLHGGIRRPQQEWDSTRGWSGQHVSGHPALNRGV